MNEELQQFEQVKEPHRAVQREYLQVILQLNQSFDRAEHLDNIKTEKIRSHPFHVLWFSFLESNKEMFIFNLKVD